MAIHDGTGETLSRDEQIKLINYFSDEVISHAKSKEMSQAGIVPGENGVDDSTSAAIYGEYITSLIANPDFRKWILQTNHIPNDEAPADVMERMPSYEDRRRYFENLLSIIEYQKKVPEHLRERSKNRRRHIEDSKRIHLQAIADALADLVVARGGSIEKDIKHTEIAKEVGFLLDIDSAELCDLDAVAVRRKLLSYFAYSDVPYNINADDIAKHNRDVLYEPVRTYPKLLRLNMRMLGFKDGRYVQVPPPGSECYRLFGSGRADRIVSWIDVPTTKIKKRFNRGYKVRIDEVDISALPIKIGFRTQYGIIPLLCSQMSDNRCHVVYASGAEISADNLNRPELMELIKDCIVHGADKIGELLERLYYGSESVPEQKLLEFLLGLTQKTTEDHIAGAIKQKQDIANPIADRIRTDAHDNSTHEITVIAQSKKGSYDIPMSSGQIREGVVRLTHSVADNAETNLRDDIFSVRVGADESIYGVDAVVAYELYRIITDGLNRSRILKMTVGGELMPVDENDHRELVRLLDSLYYRDRFRHREEKYFRNIAIINT